MYGKPDHINERFTGIGRVRKDYSGIAFRGSVFEKCLFDKCDFSGSDLRNVWFFDCEFKECKFALTLFGPVYIQNTKFVDCDFNDAIRLGSSKTVVDTKSKGVPQMLAPFKYTEYVR